MKKVYLIFPFLFLGNSALAQDEPKPLMDAIIYNANGENDKAQNCIQNFLNQSLKENNSLHIVQGYAIKSRLFTSQERFKEAAEYSNKAFELANKSKDPIEKAYAVLAKCNLDFNLSNYQNIVSDAKNEIPIAQKEHLPLLEYYLNLSIYNVYSQLGNFDLCRPYVDANLKLGSSLAPVFTTMAQFLNTILLQKQYEKNKKNIKLKDSIKSLFSHLQNEYYEGKELLPTFISVLVNDTKFVLTNDDLSKERYATFLKSRADSVFKYVQKIKINRELFTSVSYSLFAEYNSREGRIDSAIYYLKLANNTLKTPNLVYQYTKMQILNSLIELYVQQNDYKNAFVFETEKNKISKVFFDKEMENLNRKIEAQFDLKSKKAEIATLKAKEEFQSKLNYLYWGLIAMGGIAFYSVVKSYQFKLKFSKERAQNLKLEKDEAELQSKLSKEEQARLESEQNLLQIQQEQMKRELMLNMLHLEHKNSLLKNLHEKLNDGSTVNLQKIIKDENNIDLDFEQVKTQIQDIHPAFFSILSEKSFQKLTNLDVKYCAYIHLGLDTKQIAQLLNVEPKSVRMSKYRIKQKLGLDKDLDLESYLKEIIKF